MSDSTQEITHADVARLIEEKAQLFAGLKEQVVSQEERLKKAESDFAEKTAIASIESRFDAIETKLGEIDASSNRLPQTNESDPVLEAKIAAFEDYARHGNHLSEVSKKALRTNVDPQGGYLVPENEAASVLSLLREFGPWLQLANVVNISQGSVWVQPKWVTQSSARWAAENDSLTETTPPQLGQVRITTHELQCDLYATRTMLDDTNYDLRGYLRQEAADSFMAAHGTAFTSGTGAGQPEGILTYSGSDINNVDTGSATALGTGASPEVDAAENLISVTMEAKSGYHRNSSWQMSRRTEAAIRKLKDANDRFYWEPGLRAGQPNTLLGYPIFENPDLADPTSGITYASGAQPIIFGDWRRGYTIVMRRDIGILVDPYTAAPVVKFQYFMRVGGGVVQGEALTTLTCAV